MIESRIVCVVGMHRSGTSLVTRALNLVGFYLGPPEHLMENDQFNPAGFWEHVPITSLNDELLERLGGTWRDPPLLAVRWHASPELDDLRERAREIIQRDFATAGQWAWKDPRSCLTLPFWQALLPPMRYVVCMRNPIDVARSLEQRDTLPFEHSCRLWLQYVDAALRHTAGQPRVFVFYEDVMTDWRRALAPIFALAGCAEAAARQDTQNAIDSFVAEELWHFRARSTDVVDDPRLSLAPKALYLALRSIIRDGHLEGEAGEALLHLLARGAFQSERSDAHESVEKSAEHDAAVRLLTEELAARERQLGDLRVTVGALRTAEPTLRSELEALRGQRRAAERRNMELERDRAEISRRLATLHADKAAAEQRAAEAEREAETVHAHLRSRLERVRGQRNTLRGEVADQAEQIDRLTRDVRRLAERPVAPHDGFQSSVEVGQRTSSAHLAEDPDQHYLDAMARMGEVVRRAVPSGGRVLVVSRGDERLLRVGDFVGEHFPQLEAGVYAGSYPADSAAAIAHLEELRSRGAQFLVFPVTSLWWLEHYDEFAAHLDQHYEVVAREEATCVIYRLVPLAAPLVAEPTVHDAGEAVQMATGGLQTEFAALAGALLPVGELVLVLGGANIVLDQNPVRPLLIGQNGSGNASDEVIALVEEQRVRGAAFLICAAETGRSHRQHDQFVQYLEEHYRVVTRQERLGAIFDLRGAEVKDAGDRISPEDYDKLSTLIGSAIRAVVPPGRQVVVISRGDAKLIELDDRTGLHFPANEAGAWAGHYPADGLTAVGELEALRSRGAGFFVIPSTAFWWLDHYRELADRLTESGRLVWSDDHCRIYELSPAAAAHTSGARRRTLVDVLFSKVVKAREKAMM